MNLPNYFLADLPPDATLTPLLLTEACQALKQNRARYFADRSTQSVIEILAALGHNWLQPDFPFRQEALKAGPAATGFSEQTLAAGLNAFFKNLTVENLEKLIVHDLGHTQRLDDFFHDKHDDEKRCAGWARGPEFIVHITAGNIPNPAFVSIILGLLTRSAQFVKCASGKAFLPRMFAHSIYDAEPKLGACLEIAEWKGGADELEAAVFAECDCATVTGSDETLATIRQKLPAKARLLGYGTRVSFGYISHQALSTHAAKRLAQNTSKDIAAWDQLGCLSPHLIYVENGGSVSPEMFAEMLAGEMEALEGAQPRGKLSAADAAAIATRRSFYEIRSAHSMDTKLFTSAGSTAWTVIYENDSRFQLSCGSRFIYVKSVANLADALAGADAMRNKTSTVGLASTEARGAELALAFARWGATRICPLGQMQNPPLTWRHDGRPSLGDLVTWIDWEKGF
jgi:hypothetical protein